MGMTLVEKLVKLVAGKHKAMCTKAKRLAREWNGQDEAMAQFYGQFVSSGDLCFDVGANVGNRTKIFLKLGARVVAVDPQPACVDILNAIYGNNQQVVLVPQAVGAEPGEAEMKVSSDSRISSMSQDWIEAVKTSGRFSQYNWDQMQRVPVTTLDRLIQEYGVPAFLKIDVEGYELEVLKGLSQPVGTVSFEFTPELIMPTAECIYHLETLGEVDFNYSLGESMEFSLETWAKAEVFIPKLEAFKNDNTSFGDIYARYQS